MIVEASVVGLFRTILIVVGVIVLVRFIGQLMNAKRNMEEERQANERDRKLRDEKRRKEKQLGKTTILKKGSQNQGDVEDVNYEEL